MIELKHRFLISLKVDYPCGSCNMCEGRSDVTSALYAARCVRRATSILKYELIALQRGHIGLASDMRVFGLEGSPSTHKATSAYPAWTRVPPGVLSLLNMAGSDKDQNLTFQDCPIASELCKIGGGVDVPAVSVDSFRKHHHIGE